LIAIPTAKERVPNTTTEESKGGRRRKKSPFDCLDPFPPILNLLSITTNEKWVFEKKTSEPGEKGTAFLDGSNSSPQQNQQDPKLTKSSG